MNSEEANKFSKKPIDGIKTKIKSETLKNLIIKNLEMSKGTISKIDKNEVDKLYKNNQLSADDVEIIELYNTMLEECQKMYASPEWEKIWDKYKQWYYPNEQENSQTQIKAKWWQIVLSDAAGAAIGAVAGANPATCVGAATTLSTLVAKYADKPTSEQ